MFDYQVRAGFVLLGESDNLRSAQLLAKVYEGTGQPCEVVYTGPERRVPKTAYDRLRVELLNRN